MRQWHRITVDVTIGETLTAVQGGATVDDGAAVGTGSMPWNQNDKSFFIGVGALYTADIPAETKYSIDDVLVRVAK